jgi:hypothetical protein
MAKLMGNDVPCDVRQAEGWKVCWANAHGTRSLFVEGRCMGNEWRVAKENAKISRQILQCLRDVRSACGTAKDQLSLVLKRRVRRWLYQAYCPAQPKRGADYFQLFIPVVNGFIDKSKASVGG